MRANPLGKGTHIRRYSAVISNYRYISVWSGKCTAFPCRGVGMLIMHKDAKRLFI